MSWIMCLCHLDSIALVRRTWVMIVNVVSPCARSLGRFDILCFEQWRSIVWRSRQQVSWHDKGKLWGRAHEMSVLRVTLEVSLSFTHSDMRSAADAAILIWKSWWRRGRGHTTTKVCILKDPWLLFPRYFSCSKFRGTTIGLQKKDKEWNKPPKNTAD